MVRYYLIDIAMVSRDLMAYLLTLKRAFNANERTGSFTEIDSRRILSPNQTVRSAPTYFEIGRFASESCR
jgi:hypothetical protein